MMAIMASSVMAVSDVFTTSRLIDTNDSSCDTTCWRQQHSVDYSTHTFNQIRGSEGMQFYISYSCEDLNDFNEKNSDVTSIEYVELKTIHNLNYVDANLTNINNTQINETIRITNSTPFHDFKKFVRLRNGEGMVVMMNTYFNGTPVSDSVCTFETVYGTNGCTRCKEFAYVEFQQDVKERGSIQALNTNIKDRIQSVFTLNWEFLVIIFWIITLVLFLGAISGLIFGVFFLYSFVKRFFDKLGSRRRG